MLHIRNIMMTKAASVHTAIANNIDEKIDSSQAPSTLDADYNADLEFTTAQEARAVWKVDILLLPFIVICFCFLQFDRTNIGNALTDNLTRDIHVTNSDVNLSQTLFTAGFIVTELPFNMVSKYIGPQRFLPVTMFLWGTVTWAQVFLKSATGLYAARFFVGALEGGFIPGFVLYISRYYTNKELGLRYAIFWASNAFAGMLGGPLAVGLLSLSGRGRLHGWQWLFLIEGIITSVLGVVAYFYLPSSPTQARVLFGKSLRFFSDEQAAILTTRVLRDDPTKSLKYGKPVLLSHVLDTFKDWRLYGHIIAGFLSMTMIAPINVYAPSIIKSLGFTTLQANGLNSVGSACSLVFSICLAFSSDKHQERGLHVAVGYLVGAAGLLWLALAPSSVDKWTLYGGVVWTQMGMGSAQAINAAWLTAKMEDYKRPVALAGYVMSIQVASFLGSQLFRTQDAPRYVYGLLIAASCTIAAAVVALAWKALYRYVDGETS
ncbi:hypothetical protein VHEMI09890 [[Torrubiella] hemipterigena]|uniref:Major facilitator superfamily (MFS) profile domain-containing protein n=1 Tax=[Torrubiella] hemipterigena TaxID=1531966 RepID=A0A0A1TSB3_9HYPO|nr:hypothetical protein VHEMI09890 [[Torrubiella] hemipterigena]